MPLSNRAYNLATQNKWLLVLPYKQIDTSFTVDNVAFNLTNFSLPSLEIGQVNFPIHGRDIPLPTGVQNESKAITFNYMLSSDWHQYRILYKWFNKISDDNNAFQDSYQNLTMDITVYLLSEFKNPMFSIVFTGCWISSLQDIDLNYQSGEEVIQHSFTINYATYKFVDLI